MVRRQTMYLLLLAQFNEPFANQVRWMKYAVCVNSGCHVSSPYCARLFNSSKNKLMLSFRSANLGKYEYSLNVYRAGYSLNVYRAGYRLQVTGHRPQVTGYRSQVTGHRLQVTSTFAIFA